MHEVLKWKASFLLNFLRNTLSATMPDSSSQTIDPSLFTIIFDNCKILVRTVSFRKLLILNV